MFLIMFIRIISFISHIIITISFLALIGSSNYIFCFSTEIFNNIFVPIIVITGITLSFFVKNPIWALLYILSSFILVGISLLNINVEFITFFFIIVYLGALMMLFLFVIMLFNLQHLGKDISIKSTKIWKYCKIIALFIIIYNCSLLLISNLEIINISPIFFFYTNEFLDSNSLFFFTTNFINNTLIFKTLYTTESIYFIIITIILLYALIGALTVITLVKITNSPVFLTK